MMNDSVTYLGTAPPPSVGGEIYRSELPPQYGSRSNPGTPVTIRNPSPKPTSTSTTFRNSSPRNPPSTPPIYRSSSPRTESTGPAFRNITAESENYAPASTPRQGFLPLSSPSPASLVGGGPGDEKLVTRLYGQIETQEAEFNKLQFQHSEEQRRRGQLEIELAEAKQEIEENKKRINSYKKQEREHRNKYELDRKERNREDETRWEATMEEIVQLRKDVAEKKQKLAEFEFVCLNLQQSLTHEKERSKTEVTDAEKRVVLSSKMLETCHAQLSRADKQLKKERKMKQILIKINEALQREIKRLQEHVIKIKEQTELQITTSLSMQQSKETEDQTYEIMQDLQIEDALFYFEEVKRQYEDRPKVYRVFLEVIRDYKSRALSTPEVIARISKLFQGKSKLIIGFNRFLPKDYHISEEDVADMQIYNVQSVLAPPTKASSPPLSPGPPSDPHNLPTPVSGSVPSAGVEDDSERKEGVEKSNSQSEETGHQGKSVAEKEAHGDNKNEEKDIKHKESDEKSVTSKSTSSKKKKKKSSKAKKTSSKKSRGSNEKSSRRKEKDSVHPIVPSRSLPLGLTINTSSTIDEETAAKPPVKKPPPDLTDDDDFDDDLSSTSYLETEILTDLASPAVADIGSPGNKFDKFSSFNLSTVASSNLFGGIESIDDSFGVGIMSVDQTTLYMPTDRYEVIDDQEMSAIEILADHQSHSHRTSLSSSHRTSLSSFSLNKPTSSDSSYWSKS